jgi:hypothetical protein
MRGRGDAECLEDVKISVVEEGGGPAEVLEEKEEGECGGVSGGGEEMGEDEGEGKGAVDGGDGLETR